MNTVGQIADQLRACNFEHVRAVLEPDDVMVLTAYLEGQGFISAEALAKHETENAKAFAPVVASTDEGKSK